MIFNAPKRVSRSNLQGGTSPEEASVLAHLVASMKTGISCAESSHPGRTKRNCTSKSQTTSTFWESPPLRFLQGKAGQRHAPGCGYHPLHPHMYIEYYC